MIDYQNTPAPPAKKSGGSPVMMIISGVLVVALIAVGVLYGMEVGKLNKANQNIKDLEANVASLTTQLNTEKATVADLTTQLATEKTKSASLQTQLDSTKADLTASQAKVTDLTSQLATANGKVTDLTSQLATSTAKVTSTQASLDKANSDLTAALATNATQAATLKKVQESKHFTSVSELQTWLQNDDTNIAYASQSNLNRAYILQVRALRAGYIISVATYVVTSTTFAAFPTALVGDTIYQINTTNDTITPYIVGIVVVPPVNPLPLP